MPNRVQTLSELLSGGLSVNDIAMRERRTSYLHQFLAAGADWEAKAIAYEGSCRSRTEAI